MGVRDRGAWGYPRDARESSKITLLVLLLSLRRTDFLVSSQRLKALCGSGQASRSFFGVTFGRILSIPFGPHGAVRGWAVSHRLDDRLPRGDGGHVAAR